MGMSSLGGRREVVDSKEGEGLKKTVCSAMGMLPRCEIRLGRNTDLWKLGPREY